jgi:hypothetical protein
MERELKESFFFFRFFVIVVVVVVVVSLSYMASSEHRIVLQQVFGDVDAKVLRCLSLCALNMCV